MDRFNPGLASMHSWLEAEKRRGAFQGPVYGPMGMEITVRDALSHARPIEAVGVGAPNAVAWSCLHVGFGKLHSHQKVPPTIKHFVKYATPIPPNPPPPPTPGLQGHAPRLCRHVPR
jgi:hypothetical protein